MSDIKVHPISVGKNIEKFRRMRGMKQETLADLMGISRQTLSKMEQSEDVEADKLEQIAGILEIPVDALKNYNDENVIINIQNMNDHAGVYQYNFNPIEKLIEMAEENKSLYQQIISTEREKIALLEAMLKKQG